MEKREETICCAVDEIEAVEVVSSSIAFVKDTNKAAKSGSTEALMREEDLGAIVVSKRVCLFAPDY